MADFTKEEREFYENQVGKIWTTNELQQDFSVESFCAPFVVVKRRADNVKGTLQFEHSPRFYFNFVSE